MKQGDLLTFKRPYGISYDGAICQKLKSKCKDSKHKEEARSNNQTQRSHRQVSIAAQKIQVNDANDMKNAARSKNLSKMQKPEQTEQRQKEDIQCINYQIDQQLNRKQQPQKHPAQLSNKRILAISSDSQQQVNLNLPKRSFNLQNIIRKQKREYHCKCGRKYTGSGFLKIHIRTKHKNQIQKVNQVLDLTQKKQIKIDTNWQRRSIKCLQSLQISHSQLDKQVAKLNSKNITLNLQIQAQRVFYLLFNQLKIPYAKFPILYLLSTLQQFFIENQACNHIWVYNFQNFGLFSHIFYDWVCKQSQEKGKDPKYSSFILEIYLLFTSWCYHNGYISTMVTKNQILSR